MIDKLDARLDAVYRSIDEPLARIGDYIEGIGDYVRMCSNPDGFSDETREGVRQAVQEAANILNRLASIYRDMVGIDEREGVARVTVDQSTGLPALEISQIPYSTLRYEVDLFLRDEAIAADKLLRQ
jgi:hypothetical protein